MRGEAKNRNLSQNTFLNAQSVSLGPDFPSLQPVILPDDCLLLEEGGHVGPHEVLLLVPGGELVRVTEIERVVLPVVVVHPLIEVVGDVKASVIVRRELKVYQDNMVTVLVIIVPAKINISTFGSHWRLLRDT